MTLFFFERVQWVVSRRMGNPRARNTYKFVFIRQVIPCLTRLQKFSRNIVRNWVRINFFVNLCHLFCRSMDYYRSFISIKTLYSLSQILDGMLFQLSLRFMEIIKTLFTHHTTIGDAKAVAFTNDEAIRRSSFVVITNHDAIHFEIPASRILYLPRSIHCSMELKSEQIINNQILFN